MRTYFSLLLFSAMGLFVAESSADTTRVVHAYSAYVIGLSSGDEETRIGTIRKAVPTENEVSRIWMDERKATLAWNLIKTWSDKMIADNKKVHAEIISGGGLLDVSVRDYRKTKHNFSTRSISAVIPLYIISAKHEKGSVTTCGMLVDGRVVLVDSITQICTALEKIGPGAGGAGTEPAKPVKEAQKVDRTNPRAVAEAFWKAVLAKQWENAAQFVHEDDREWFLEGAPRAFLELPNPPKHPVIGVMIKDGDLGWTKIDNWKEGGNGIEINRTDGIWWIEN